MSVNSVDYSKNLAEARDKYITSSNEMRSEFNKQKIDLENRHKAQQKGQREVFQGQKLKLEDRLEKTVNANNEKLNESIKKQTNQYNNSLEEEKENFKNDREKTHANFNRKLSRVRNSFDSSLKENAKTTEARKISSKKQHEAAAEVLRNNFDDKLKTIGAREKLSNSNVLDQAKIEKQSLIDKNESIRNTIIQDSNLAKNKLKNDSQMALESLRKNSVRTEKMNTIQSDNRADNIIKNKNGEIDRIKKSFVELNEDLQELNEKTAKAQRREAKRSHKNMSEQFKNDRLAIERKSNNLINDDSNDQYIRKLDSQKKSYENRISNLKNKMNDNALDAKTQNENISRSFQGELQQKDLLASKNMLDQKIDLTKENQFNKIKNKTKLDTVSTKYREALNNSETSRVQEGTRANTKLKNTVSRNQIQFAKTINEINDDNRRQLNNTRDEYSQENLNSIRKMQDQLSEDKQIIKKRLSEKFTKTQEGLVNALDSKENDIRRMQEIYETRISALNKKNGDEMEQLKDSFIFQKKLNDKDNKRSLSLKQSEWTMSRNSMRNDFDKKLRAVKNKNDIFVNKLTERYETRLKSERTTSQRELSSKDRWAQDEIGRLRTQSKLEKNSLIQQYELKLDKLKQATALEKELKNDHKKA